MSIESVMPSNQLILCCPLFLPLSIFPSIRVFSNESALRIRWPKYWSFCFSISPSSEHPGLISFRMDWLDLLAVQWTPTPQLKSINSLVLSFLYSPTLTSIYDWKNHSFDSGSAPKVMVSQLFYTLLSCNYVPFSRGSSQPRDLTQVFSNAGEFLTI